MRVGGSASRVKKGPLQGVSHLLPTVDDINPALPIIRNLP